MDEAFRSEMADGYRLDEPAIMLGSPMLGDEVLTDVRVQIALSRINRHGLIAGATGTGKTKTLQMSRRASCRRSACRSSRSTSRATCRASARRATRTDPHVIDRCTSIGWTFQAAGHPLEILSLSGNSGAHVRASVSSFGPLLLGKVLDLNDTQTSILSLVFRYCDDQHLPLLDLADLRTTLKFLGSDDGKPVLEDLGGISPASLGVILRAIVTIEQEGADIFFGEPEFDVNDLLRTTARRPRHRDPARGRRRHGQAAAVLDVRAVDAGPAVREPARGRRPARSPSSRSSSTRRTCCSRTRRRRCSSRSSGRRG